MKVSAKKIATMAVAIVSALSLSACGGDEQYRRRGSRLGGIGGCAPITSPIVFTGNGIYFDYAQFIGGTSGGQTQGDIIVNGGYGTYGATGGQFGRSSAEATISMNVMPINTGYNQYNQYNQPTGYNTTTDKRANVTGSIQLTSTGVNNIMMAVQMGQIPIGNTGAYPGGYPVYDPYNPYPTYPNSGYPSNGYPGYYPQQSICVTDIAMYGQVYPSEGVIYNAWVYLYLNNTQNGYPLYF